MDKDGMRLSRSVSTSTHVEHAHDLSDSSKEEKKRKISNVLDVNSQEEKKKRNAKKVRASKRLSTLHVTIAGLASTLEDVHDEIKKLTQSFKEMTETMKKQQELLLARPDLPKETPKQKVEIKRECAFAAQSESKTSVRSIFVKGFDPSLPRDDVERALIEHFRSCGEILEVFVPFPCYWITSFGYAFIEFKDGGESKALLLNGSYMGGKMLEVTMAIEREEYDNYDIYPLCKDCIPNVQKRIHNSFYDRHRM